MKINKLLELPIINQIYDYICDKQFDKEIEKYERNYISQIETKDMFFIWGIMSYDDLSGSTKANMFTMNDIELIYHKDIDKYSLGVETIYTFIKKGQYGYMQNLLDEFTKWMEKNNYNTNREFCLYDVFTAGISINSKFNTIEDAYTAFKMIVNGFCSLENNTETN